tara:strand:+ start:217 stop:435 length:219 start_codon:yes stop_codon:yes gene_type:complete
LNNQSRHQQAELGGTPVSFQDRKNDRERPPDYTNIRFAKFLYVTLYKRHIEEALANTSRARGVKQDSAKMRR